MSDKQLPIVVSYFTARTPYEQLADRLRASCDCIGLEHYIVMRGSMGSWEANTHAKATVCQQAWRTLGKPILWLDADAIIHQTPELLCGTAADFGVHVWKGQYFASGTVFFNQTPIAGLLIDNWVAHCKTDPTISDQPHLQRAWDGLSPVNTLWLPRSYCQIFDSPRDEPPVIEHFQASRTQRVTA